MPYCYKDYPYALQLVVVEFLGALAISAVGSLVNQRVAISLLVGGLICALANFGFAIVALRPRLGASPGRMLSAFYMAELAKFTITALLFLLAFRQLEWLKDASNVVALFAGYLVVQAAAWIFPLFKK